jgi:hypothetical protein
MPQERGNRSLGWIEPVAVRLARFLQSSDRVFMRKPTPSRRRRPTASVKEIFVVGRDRFARISAVEGIALTDEMRATFDQFDREGLSAD